MIDPIGAYEPDKADVFAAQVFAAQVTDEMLEAAACAGPEHAGVFTVALCTVMADCSS